MRVRGLREGEGRFREEREKVKRVINENIMLFLAFLPNMMGSEQSIMQ